MSAHVFGLGFITLLRVVVLIALAQPDLGAGRRLGRPAAALARVVQPFAQFLAAFPANLLFPLAVVGDRALQARTRTSGCRPLMILGTQWYILFNVIAGASAIPNELRDAAPISSVRGWLWWRQVALPAVFPYYVTGAITASGGSWNASIVAEVVSWGDTKLEAHGLGAYIAEATAAGDFPRIVLGIAVMSLFVVAVQPPVLAAALLPTPKREFRLDLRSRPRQRKSAAEALDEPHPRRSRDVRQGVSATAGRRRARSCSTTSI